MKIYFQMFAILFLTALSICAQNVSPEQRIKDYFKAFNSGDEKITIVVLSNYDPPSAGIVAQELRKMISRIKP